MILGFKRWRPKIPGVLVAVVAATLAVGLFDLAKRYGLSLVGTLPQGLPSFQLPTLPADNMGTLVAGAVGIALVSFADTSVLSRTFAIRGGYRVDPNQEMVALGAANAAAGLFQGFSISSSSSRTPVAEAGRCQDPADRAGRRGGDRADAAVLPQHGPEFARFGAGRGGDLRVDQPDRDRRGRQAVPACARPSSPSRSCASSGSRSSG